MNLTSINQIASNFLAVYKQQLQKNKTTGSLADTASYMTKFNGRYLTISLNLQDYWKYVEDGTRPHFPPIEDILQWIKVKPVLPRKRKGKLPTQKQLAYLISRKISKVGTKPQPFLKNTLSSFDLVGKIYDEVTELINKQLIEEIDNELE